MSLFCALMKSLVLRVVFLVLGITPCLTDGNISINLLRPFRCAAAQALLVMALSVEQALSDKSKAWPKPC